MSDIPPRITAVLAVFYFLYENSRLNTEKSTQWLCDHTERVTFYTHFYHHRELRFIADDLGISADLLKK